MGGRIIKATFQVKFSDAKTPPSLVIESSTIAQSTRDDDRVLIEQWPQPWVLIIIGPFTDIGAA